jgi:hypothetical protein
MTHYSLPKDDSLDDQVDAVFAHLDANRSGHVDFAGFVSCFWPLLSTIPVSPIREEEVLE